MNIEFSHLRSFMQPLILGLLVWVVYTVNLTNSDMKVLKNDIQYMKEDVNYKIRSLDDKIKEKGADRYTATQAKTDNELLNSKIQNLNIQIQQKTTEDQRLWGQVRLIKDALNSLTLDTEKRFGKIK